MNASSHAAAAPVEDTDRTAIENVVAEMESAFNHHDAVALDQHLTRDAVWVNPFGERLTGWDDINHMHKALLAGPLRECYACYHVESCTLVRPDVAVVQVRQHATSAEGRLIEGSQHNIALFVMLREEGQWRICAAQNTLVQALRFAASSQLAQPSGCVSSA